MADNIEFDATHLPRTIYMGNSTESCLRIECIWCDDADYMFYEGDSQSTHTEDWVRQAVIHATTYHPDRLKEIL